MSSQSGVLLSAPCDVDRTLSLGATGRQMHAGEVVARNVLAKVVQQEEQLSSCRSSAREVKPVDKPPQTWTGKKSKMDKNLKMFANHTFRYHIEIIP